MPLPRNRFLLGVYMLFTATTVCMLVILWSRQHYSQLLATSTRGGIPSAALYPKVHAGVGGSVTTGTSNITSESLTNVSLKCRTVCDSTTKGKVCVPMNIAVMVLRNDVPLANMNVQQMVYPQIRVPRARANEDHTEDCIMEQHFPGRYLIPKQNRCAVVGNGGILLGSGCGDAIDAHDFIIRCNMAPTEGYENDVGRKTHLSGINKETLRRVSDAIRSHQKPARKQVFDAFIRHIHHLNDSIFWYPKLMSGGHDSRFLLTIETARNYSQAVRFAYDWAPVHIEKEWKLRKYGTMGFDVYAIAQAFCSNVTLYGFYPFHQGSSGRNLSHHYFEDVPYEYKNRVHDFSWEYKRLQSLAKEGRLSLVSKACEIKKN